MEVVIINLRHIQFNLINIVLSISQITGLEYAIFNTDAELISCTDIYSTQKGQNVHTPSINEVLSKGNVVVNRPGLMNSCNGCRFVNNCPSTIEILSCIKYDNQVIGVISLTSFSKEEHNRISMNTQSYTNMLVHVSNLVSMFIYNKNLKIDTYLLKEALNHKFNEANSKLLVINKNGNLIYWDHKLEELFSYCDLYSQTIHSLFPEDIINWLFSNELPSKIHLHLDNIEGMLSIIPLKIDNKISGYTLKIDQKIITNTNLQTGRYLDSIISLSPKIHEIKKLIIQISDSPSSILITGDTGTGKEMIAKAIHYQGNRANEPFIPINCANIPESLFESELFGYEEGAFTGAKRGGKLGLFEAAGNGTIFLDEIGELTLYQQAKLLRVLQEKSIQRVGGNTTIPLNMRIISATNCDLENMMEEDSFRSDLYYRINVIPISLPSLEERTEDIFILVKHFINKYNAELNNNIDSISSESLELLRNYPWPGNIRELENTIEYAVNMEISRNIQLYNLPPKVRDYKHVKIDHAKALQENEFQLISNILNENGWDLKGKEKTAEELGISLRTLYRKLEQNT